MSQRVRAIFALNNKKIHLKFKQGEFIKRKKKKDSLSKSWPLNYTFSNT